MYWSTNTYLINMNDLILVNDITKIYQVIKKEEGIRGSIKNLLHKKYDTKIAVDNISFEIEKGEFVGFIGPNGAGKTTTIKLLAGIVYPTSGDINVFGYIPQKMQNEFKKKISVTLGQKNQLWWDIPAKDSFNLLRVIYDIQEEQFIANLNELTDLLEVDKLLNTPLRNLSLGERMKMELIGALLYEPEMLLLDEPTIGLDVISRRNIRDFLKYINIKKKTTVILTSHYLEDIEYLCDRIIAIDKGIKIYDGSIKNIKNKMIEEKLIMVSSLKSEKLEMLREYCESAIINNNTIKMRVKNEKMSDLGKLLFTNNDYFDINIEEVSLDDTFEILFK